MFVFIVLSSATVISVRILEFHGEFWRKVDKKDTYNFSVYVLVDN